MTNTPDELSSVDTESVEYWTEWTGHGPDDSETREALRALHGTNDDTGRLLRLAADLSVVEPDALMPLRLDPVDYARVVAACHGHGVVTPTTSERDFGTHVLSHHTSASDAARAALAHVPGEYAPTVNPDGTLTDDEIEQIRVWTINMTPVTHVVEVDDRFWLLYS